MGKGAGVLHTAVTRVYEKRSPLYDDPVHSRHWPIFEDVCKWCTLAVCVSRIVAALAVAPVVLSSVCAHVRESQCTDVVALTFPKSLGTSLPRRWNSPPFGWHHVP